MLKVNGEAVHLFSCSRGQLFRTVFVFLSTFITQSLLTPNSRRTSLCSLGSFTRKKVTP